MKHIGKTYPIHDAHTKVTGEMQYVGDMHLPRMCHAALLLSPVPHARIVSIDTAAAEAMPGVFDVFTFREAAEMRFSSAKLIPEEADCIEDEPLFAETVRYVGDRIAAVVAQDADVARDAVKRIQVEYEPLAVVGGIKEIYRKSGFQDSRDAELIGRFDFDIGAQKTPADSNETLLKVETRVHTPKIHHAAMENHVCLADYSSTHGMTIWTPCQGVFGVRTTVADLLGLAYTDVRVVKMPMGGSFGGKQEALLEPVTAFMAYKTRRPVKLQLERRACISSTMTRPATITAVDTQVTSDGRLKTCRIQSLLDAGAYVSSSKGYIRALGSKIWRAYRPERVVHTARAYRTHTTKAGGARGWGSPEFFSAMEIHMDQIADRLAIDPVKLRLINAVKPGDMDPVRKVSLGNVQLGACLRQGAEAFDWRRKRSRRRDGGRLRQGVGMACGGHTNSMIGGFVDFSSMRLSLNDDGTLVLNTAVHDMGCGTLTTMRQIVAEVLDVPLDWIRVLEADTLRSPYDFGTYASRVTYICGACAKKVAEKMRQKILAVSRRALETSWTDLVMAEGSVWLKGRSQAGGLDFKSIAKAAMMQQGKPISAEAVHTAATNPGSYGAHFAGVEVDSYTGLVRVVDYLAAHDVGRAINPGMVQGQVQGAVQMGIGYALSEEVRVDDSGRLCIDGFKDYHLVNAPDMPDIGVLLLEGGGDEGPFGAKSIGEIALVPVAAAVVNAVNHALRTRLTDLPLVPEKVLAALDEG